MRWAVINFNRLDTCQSNYGELGVRVDGRLHLCASDNGTDPSPPVCAPDSQERRCQLGFDYCEADSGGPLMVAERVESGLKYHSVGVLSFAVGCGNARYPGIYTRVDSYLDWIAQTIAGN
ncbi:acrosin-like [Pollicipes pollicipes]|uniref:acrosin-like n=1 Tax=Pollicipes pollicipes TaxID=41117 RepID=UPI001884DDB1|nr:acrosin-like [Pollicipes pollicipes]